VGSAAAKRLFAGTLFNTVRLFALAVLTLSISAVASEVAPHTLKQRAAASTRVVVARLMSQKVLPSDTADKLPHTDTVVAVVSSLKGTGPKQFTVVQRGGTIGPRTSTVVGDAKLDVGQTMVLFVRCETETVCALVALSHGALPVKRDTVSFEDLFTGEQKTMSMARFKQELSK
jgi:hypothetical protein